jgi:hypothetical protein
MDAEIRRLSNAVIGEIFLAMGFSKHGIAYKLFRGLFYRVADRLSSIALTADRMIATDGFSSAAGWMLGHWCKDVRSRGETDIPPTGPLLVISNHAGTYDTFLLANRINRNDLKLIASDVPFLKNLPNANDHLLFLSDSTGDRMLAARHAMKYLKDGGSILLYGTGLIDPDPAVYPGADLWIEKWLPSIDLFLRIAPETKIVLSVVSGVVAEHWAHHPVTWLSRVDWQKRRLAEFSQVIDQLLHPGKYYLKPCVSFSQPLGVNLLRKESSSERLLPAVIARGKQLLSDHCQAYNNCAKN